MNNQYSLPGTKIIMRRLFKYDTEEIMECFGDYKQLFYSPINSGFINNVFVDGEFWGAFVNDTIIACSYLFPFDCSISKKEKQFEQLADFIENPSEYLMLGYIGFHHSNINSNIPPQKSETVCSSICKAFLNIAEMQAFRRGSRFVVHCVPLKLAYNLSSVFESGYKLIKLRGLEKLVVHYIFSKEVYHATDGETQKEGESRRVAASNTKALSRFLENDYCAFDVKKEGSETVFILKKSISD